MRELKFRALDLDYNFMDYDFYISSTGVAYDVPSRTFDTPNTEIEEQPNYVVMQFTGLKDRNGVDIYEGDIVNDDLMGICQVKFNELHAAFKIVHKNGRTAKWFVDYLPNEFKYLKVIGNIHQHKHLLEN